MTNHYLTLGLPPKTAPLRLYARYLELAKIHHPDAGGEGERFRQLTEAWNVLKDKVSRANYDRRLELEGRICPQCHGTGQGVALMKREPPACKSCAGSGLK